MSDWVISNVQPSLAWMGREGYVPSVRQTTYTLLELRTGELKRITCGLQDRWADRFLTAQSSRAGHSSSKATVCD
jgi:hypothetical protein